jgi:hypothetical protein
MKHLLSGVALAAVIAVAAPVWAQTSVAPSPPTLPSTTQATSQVAPPALPRHPTGSVTATATRATSASVATVPKGHRVVRTTHNARYASQGYHAWHRHYGRHGGYGLSGGYGGGWSDHVANQLNGQELGRLGESMGGYGSTAPPMPGYRSY